MIIKPTTVTVIVISYNRPRMLAEALQSIYHADEILVMDDGSDFDVDRVVRDNAPPDCPIILTKKPSLTVEERLITPRVGKSMNEAIRCASSEVIAYLCDDDIFTPEWILGVKEYYDSGGLKGHWVRGLWGIFVDPHNPLRLEDTAEHLRCNICPMGGHGLTTGSFAHLVACSYKCGVWWSDASVAIHDSYFVSNYERIHQEDPAPLIKVAAGWRREHPFNMMKHASGDDKYLASGEEVFRGGMLE